MSLLSRLFGGGGSAPESQSETYKDFTITPAPSREGGRFRVGATIEKDGKTHHLIRADVLETLDDATATSLRKARQVIDEQGDRIFG
ncbi:MAG: hypothetical protein LJE62_01795 [Silicimonas sp.]|jgi:hypothetical protein|nr:hypothetical protein [Silicimonas sp.]